MLCPITQLLRGKRMILASGSPRRRQILENIGFPFHVVSSEFEENLDKSQFEKAWQYAESNAAGKAKEVAERLKDQDDWSVVVGADTIVVSNDRILEKPKSNQQAREMITMLSGHTHKVYTGIAIVRRDRESEVMEVFHEVTKVTFAQLEDAVIDSYIQSGEPMDKAGGYGIQGLGGTLIESIEGDYFNVVGLPLHKLCLKLLEILRRD